MEAALEWVKAEAGPSFCPLDAPIDLKLTAKILQPVSVKCVGVSFVADSTRASGAAARTVVVPGTSTLLQLLPEASTVGDIFPLGFSVQVLFKGRPLNFGKLDTTELNNVGQLSVSLTLERVGPIGQTETVTETLNFVVQVAPSSSRRRSSPARANELTIQAKRGLAQCPKPVSPAPGNSSLCFLSLSPALAGVRSPRPIPVTRLSSVVASLIVLRRSSHSPELQSTDNFLPAKKPH